MRPALKAALSHLTDQDRPDPFDPASYGHICNERNAQGAARMARMIAPYLERNVK